MCKSNEANYRVERTQLRTYLFALLFSTKDMLLSESVQLGADKLQSSNVKSSLYCNKKEGKKKEAQTQISYGDEISVEANLL